ncbi:hypothetical protein [Streptomyces sp. CAU 1734]|uniref:hypothetical protein n=1 Tax=Streptomyces sp. CAU 1734 TaxID=3140360 RepID=UPI003260A990
MTGPAQPPPPEALLIRIAREAKGLSPEAATRHMRIKFSGSRWRQIEAGYRKDTREPVIAPAITLAHMAYALEIASARLNDTGRTDAGRILEELESAGGAEQSEAADPGPLVELEGWQQQIILNALDERPRSAKEKALLLRTLASKLEAQETGAERPTAHRKE